MEPSANLLANLSYLLMSVHTIKQILSIEDCAQHCFKNERTLEKQFFPSTMATVHER